jgi:hypothetical protein
MVAGGWMGGKGKVARAKGLALDTGRERHVEEFLFGNIKYRLLNTANSCRPVVSQKFLT